MDGLVEKMQGLLAWWRGLPSLFIGLVKRDWLALLVVLGACLFFTYPSWTPVWHWLLWHAEPLRNLFLIIAAVVGAIFIYWRTTIANTEAETKKRDSETNKKNSLNNLNSMYTTTMQQLGKEHEKGRPNLEVRTGTLYSLEKLAQANPEYRQSVMDVLCRYVRDTASLPKGRGSPEEHEYASQYRDKPRADAQTALTIIGRSNIEPGGQRQPIDLSNCYLVGANLQGVDLRVANLQGVDLQEANLQGANLEGADLRVANLQGANLYKANLQGVDLREANLAGADLYGANLREANLREADLVKADLEGADLQGTALRGVSFQKVKLQGVNLQGVNLQGANLKGAELQSADLRWVDLRWADLQEADLQGANLQGAKLQVADLRACRNLTCDQLQQAENWEQAPRDSKLACGANIPYPPGTSPRSRYSDPSEKDKKEAEQKGKDV